jgi:hypothetical protein
MTLYLAASWDRQDVIRRQVPRFERVGHQITYRWWEQPGATDPVILRRQAAQDLDGVAQAEALVLYYHHPSEGKAVEMGFALGRGIPVLVVGAPPPGCETLLFHHHPAVQHVATTRDAIARLYELSSLRKRRSHTSKSSQRQSITA